MEDVKTAVCELCFQLINDNMSLTSVDNVRIMVRCLLPDNDTVENTYVYLYDRLDNIAPLPLIKRMLECSLIFLNLEYRQYPVMCNDCWKILKISFGFLMRCVQNDRQLYKEHNYTLVSKCNIIDLRDAMSNQTDFRNYIYDDHNSVESVFSNLKTKMEDQVLIIKQEVTEETENNKEHQSLNNAFIEVSSNRIEINQEKNENTHLTQNSISAVEKCEFENNLETLELEDCDIKPFEKINIAGDKVLENSYIKENEIVKIEANSSAKISWPNRFKKNLYIKLERLVLRNKNSLMEGTRKYMQKYMCHLCSFSSNKKYRHTRHLTTHMTLKDCAKNNALFKCNNCNYITKLKYSLRRHMQQVHIRFIYTCQKCNYKTNETENYRLHVKLKHNNNLKVYNCEFCSYSSCTKLSLKQHVKTHEKIILKCSQCTFETKQILAINKHMMNHKNMRVSKLYKCEVCTYQIKKKIQYVTPYFNSLNKEGTLYL